MRSGALGNIGTPATIVVDRCYHAVLRLGDVERVLRALSWYH